MSGHVLARVSDLGSLVSDRVPAAPERAVGAPEAQARTSVQLTSLARNATGTVAGVRIAATGGTIESNPADERMALRLIEIGFVEGATLRVIAFGQPGDDPIGVRVGGRGGVSTFALRRQEASCVWVWPDNP